MNHDCRECSRKRDKERVRVRTPLDNRANHLKCSSVIPPDPEAAITLVNEIFHIVCTYRLSPHRKGLWLLFGECL